MRLLRIRTIRRLRRRLRRVRLGIAIGTAYIPLTRPSCSCCVLATQLKGNSENRNHKTVLLSSLL
ncbi:hypothetical protein TcasGA2_TC016094 [Tribolium castaneum]|uniref:Uncharacterized protein n=1 Tax=Tribolium castaneum TaxID=7070 RepID=D6X3L9_TRICA|nr:hypothetical protein TcasGA2_TC016094 [Tribolium castaneum]